MEKITSIVQIFNNRELAIILWAVVFFVWISKKPNVISSLLGFLKALVKAWLMLLSMIIYVILSIFLLYKLSFWHQSLLKITLFWFFGWGFIMFVNISNIKDNKNFFKKTILDIVGFTVFISFISNFYTFSLFVEILLVPFIITTTALISFSEIYKKYDLAYKIMNWIMATLGATIILINLLKAISDFNMFATIETLQEFLLPILLSIMFLPFIYGLSRYIKYQSKRVMDKFMKEKEATRAKMV